MIKSDHRRRIRVPQRVSDATGLRLFIAGWGVVFCLMGGGCEVLAEADASLAATGGSEAGLGEVRVGLLVYAEGKRGVCYSEGFLTEVRRQTGINVHPSFEPVELGSDAVFDYPIVIMSGEGPFELSQDEVGQLKAYLFRGGFLLASAGCTNAWWAESFEKVFAQVFPADRLERLGLDHPIFHTLYQIDRLPTRQSDDPAEVYGLEQAGTLVAVYSPTGLNDTAAAGMGCCCCGGNEIRNALQVNANILTYVLTH